jgi:hypothetical protein
MRRQLFTVASAISLLLCVGSAGLWVRSYSRFYWATRYYAMNRQITFATEPSRLVMGRTFIPAKWFGEKYDEQWDLRSEELPYLYQIPWRWRFLGFDTNRIADNWEGAPVTNEVLIPFWFLTLLFAVFPAARLMHRFRRSPSLSHGFLPYLLLFPNRQHQRRLPRMWHAEVGGGRVIRSRLVIFVVLVSLFLCVGTVVLSAQSFRTMVALFHFQRGQTRWQLVATRGSIQLNNQPQLDFEQSQLKALDIAEMSREVAVGQLQARWLQRYNGLRFEDVEPDAETRAWIDRAKAANQNYMRVAALVRTMPVTPRVSYDLPLLFAAALAAALPAIWTVTTIRRLRRRRQHECCLACGYNLTGNTSGVCPECGAACKAANPAGVSPAAGD